MALRLAAGPAFVKALRRAWDRGQAVLPVDPRLPPTAATRLLASLAPTHVIDEAGEERALGGGRGSEDGDALVVATSGTTGEPKGVVLTHDAVMASAVATSRRLAVTASDRWLACLPPAHMGGLAVITRALLTDTPLTALSGFDPEAVLREANRGATLVSLVPTALARIDAAAFRLILLGGAAPPTSPPANTVVTYGMTETGSGVVYDGVPLDGVDLRLVDHEVQVRGPMLLRAYRSGADPKDADPKDADGWLATGDLGRMVDGRLVVDGRRDELIVTGGENVWPGPVEAALTGLAGIADARIVGAPDPEWGMRVVAEVVPMPSTRPIALDDLRARLRDVLPAYALPREVRIVDRIPRTSSGKRPRAHPT